MKKQIWAALCAAALLCSAPLTALAGVWQTGEQGYWYQNDDGSFPANAWMQDKNAWYHFDANGYMQTGWIKIGQTWYYLNPDGAMRTNNLTENGVIYRFGADGACENPGVSAPAAPSMPDEERAELDYYTNYVIFSLNTLAANDATASWGAMMSAGRYDELKASIREVRVIFEDFAGLTPPAKYAPAHAELKQACDSFIRILDIMSEMLDGALNGTLTQEQFNRLYAEMQELNGGIDAHFDAGGKMMQALTGQD